MNNLKVKMPTDRKFKNLLKHYVDQLTVGLILVIIMVIINLIITRS